MSILDSICGIINKESSDKGVYEDSNGVTYNVFFKSKLEGNTLFVPKTFEGARSFLEEIRIQHEINTLTNAMNTEEAIPNTFVSPLITNYNNTPIYCTTVSQLLKSLLILLSKSDGELENYKFLFNNTILYYSNNILMDESFNPFMIIGNIYYDYISIDKVIIKIDPLLLNPSINKIYKALLKIVPNLISNRISIQIEPLQKYIVIKKVTKKDIEDNNTLRSLGLEIINIPINFTYGYHHQQKKLDKLHELQPSERDNSEVEDFPF